MIPFPTRLREKSFVVTAEPLMPGKTKQGLCRDVNVLSPVVDAIQIGDGRQSQVQMSPLAAAAIVLEGGADPIMHLTCRDRNRMALHGELIGAAALGIQTLILSRGEKLDKLEKQNRKGVFEINGAELIGLADQIGKDKQLIAPPGFLLGSFATVFDPAADWSPKRLLEKSKLGLRFVQTQPCLNLALLKRYMAHLVEVRLPYRLDVLVEVPLITSIEDVHHIKTNQPGSPIMEGQVKLVLTASDPTSAGIALCSRTLREVAKVPGVGGANVRYFGQPEHAAKAIADSGLAD